MCVHNVFYFSTNKRQDNLRQNDLAYYISFVIDRLFLVLAYRCQCRCNVYIICVDFWVSRYLFVFYILVFVFFSVGSYVYVHNIVNLIEPRKTVKMMQLWDFERYEKRTLTIDRDVNQNKKRRDHVIVVIIVAVMLFVLPLKIVNFLYVLRIISYDERIVTFASVPTPASSSSPSTSMANQTKGDSREEKEKSRKSQKGRSSRRIKTRPSD